MIIKTDEHGFVKDIQNNNGEDIGVDIIGIKIEASGKNPRPKVEMTVRLKTADLEVEIDNISIKADLKASFYAMSKEERKGFVDIIKRSGLLE